jgi:rubrerythrin
MEDVIFMNSKEFTVCPICGEKLNIWSNIDYQVDQIIKHWGCPSCSATGTATFTLQFESYKITKRGKSGKEEKR